MCFGSKMQFISIPSAASDVCPPSEDRPENCRTCCCKASDNADFYHPDTAAQQRCTATGMANYKVSLIPSISTICHSGYPFVSGAATSSYFSDLLLTVHNPVQVFDSCGGQVKDGAYQYISRTEDLLPTIRDRLDSEVDAGDIENFHLGRNVLERGKRKRRSARINVTPSAPYLTLISKLVGV